MNIKTADRFEVENAIQRIELTQNRDACGGDASSATATRADTTAATQTAARGSRATRKSATGYRARSEASHRPAQQLTLRLLTRRSG